MFSYIDVHNLNLNMHICLFVDGVTTKRYTKGCAMRMSDRDEEGHDNEDGDEDQDEYGGKDEDKDVDQNEHKEEDEADMLTQLPAGPWICMSYIAIYPPIKDAREGKKGCSYLPCITIFLISALLVIGLGA